MHFPWGYWLMLLRNKKFLALLAGFVATALAAQTLPPPPDDLPKGEGPRGTSQAVPGQERYDEVGYAASTAGDGAAVTITHRSLPAGSYVEITSLDSGRTVAAIVAAGAPPSAGRIAALSPAAAQLLGVGDQPSFPVRVRRIDPTAQDQLALRSGRAASDRLDAPKVLVAALRKRLPAVPRAVTTPPPAPSVVRGPVPKLNPGTSYAPPEMAPTQRAPARVPAPPVRGGGLYVQIAALSNAARADALASSMGGIVVPGGGVYRVRTGPYSNAQAAQNARDAAAAQGYGDARVVRDQ